MAKALTIREAAFVAGKSERWIRMQIHSGALPATKEEMGQIYTWLIDSEDLEKWLKRAPAPRGRSAGPRGRARYVVSVPATKTAETDLITMIKVMPGATLQRGHGPLLVDNREEIDK